MSLPFEVMIEGSWDGSTLQLAFRSSMSGARRAAFSLPMSCATGMLPKRGSPL